MAQAIMKGISTAASLAFTLFASAILIAIGLIGFIITLVIVKYGALLLGYGAIDGNWAVLAAAILTTGSMIGSAIKR